MVIESGSEGVGVAEWEWRLGFQNGWIDSLKRGGAGVQEAVTVGWASI